MATPTDWLREAEDDLQSARDLLPHRRSKHICWLAQQAAEKALKAVLLKLWSRVPKTHDLRRLWERIQKQDPSFPDHSAAARKLTPYYVLLRYPDTRPLGWAAPALGDAEEALRMAEAILVDVRARIAPPPPAAPAAP